MKQVWIWIKGQPVLGISFLAAVLSMCFVPPDGQYLTYCNRGVLIQLFCLMLTVAAFRSIGVFEAITRFLLRRARTVRRLGLILMCLCFFTSMLVTNDVALLTFVPLTLLLFRKICDARSLVWVIVIETAAANLGSMMTPVGNPQNLYLYAEYHLTAGTFLQTLLPVGLISFVCLAVLCLVLPKELCRANLTNSVTIPKGHALGYGVMFLCCLATVFRWIPDWACLLMIVGMALVLNRKLFGKVDYALLATFVCFFIFVGNLARIDVIRDFLQSIIAGQEMVISALVSQCISNVPAAVMLAGFTDQARALLLGVNIGGMGTPIASLASLISYQFYSKSHLSVNRYYLAVFSLVNFGLLALLLLAASGMAIS